MGEKYAVCGPTPFVEQVMSALRSDPSREITSFAQVSELSALDPEAHVIVVVGDQMSKEVGLAALALSSRKVSIFPRLDYAASLPVDDRHVLSGHRSRVGFLKCLASKRV